MKIYSVHDVQLAAFGRPFYAETDGVAVRSFADPVMDSEHQFGKFPGDFCLYEIGSFDEVSGEIKGSVPKRVVGGLEVKKMFAEGGAE